MNPKLNISYMPTMQVLSPFTFAIVFSLCSVEWVLFPHYIIPSRSPLLRERWWHSSERVLFFPTSAFPQYLTSSFAFTFIPWVLGRNLFRFPCCCTDARCFWPYKVNDDARTRASMEPLFGQGRLLTSRNGEESQQQRRQPAVHHQTCVRARCEPEKVFTGMERPPQARPQC